MGPFICSNWKQLSLPVYVVGDGEKAWRNFLAYHGNIFITWRTMERQMRTMFWVFFPERAKFSSVIKLERVHLMLLRYSAQNESRAACL